MELLARKNRQPRVENITGIGAPTAIDAPLRSELFSTQQLEFNGQYDTLFKNMLKGFKDRQVSLVEFVDFFDTYKDTKLKMLQQRYNLQKAIADLNFATGTTVIKP